MAVLDKQYYDKQIRRSLTGSYHPHGNPDEADCVIATGFGYRINDGRIVPSVTTRQIAQVVHQFEHLPKIITHDLADAYTKLFPHHPDLMHVLTHPQHLSSIHIANKFHDYMKHHGLHKAVLITHQHHLPWLDYLCAQIDVMTVVPPGLAFAFDPVSVDPWTRDEAAWQHEIQTRLQRGYDEAYMPETLEFHNP